MMLPPCLTGRGRRGSVLEALKRVRKAEIETMMIATAGSMNCQIHIQGSSMLLHRRT